jgi:hypothetical protein
MKGQFWHTDPVCAPVFKANIQCLHILDAANPAARSELSRPQWQLRTCRRLYTKRAKSLTRGRARHARFHFLRRDIFDVSADRPLIAERIEKGSGTIAVELIFHRTQDFGSRCDCLF